MWLTNDNELPSFLPEFDTAVLRSLDDELVCSDLEEDGGTTSSYLSYLSAEVKELPLKGVESPEIIQLYEDMKCGKHATHMVRLFSKFLCLGQES